MTKTPLNKIFWPDARGWIGLGVFGLTVMLLLMMKDRGLREDEFFQTIATVIISNGLMAVVAWAYSATKGGGEVAEANASVAKALADKATVTPANGEPLPVEVNQPLDKPVPVATDTEDNLPEYARA